MGGSSVTDLSRIALSVWGKKLDFNSEVDRRVEWLKKAKEKGRICIVLFWQ